jgi:uncharacterized protein (UPF0248 family)
VNQRIVLKPQTNAFGYKYIVLEDELEDLGHRRIPFRTVKRVTGRLAVYGHASWIASGRIGMLLAI